MYSIYPKLKFREKGTRFFRRRTAAALLLASAIMVTGACRNQSGEDMSPQSVSRAAAVATGRIEASGSRSLLRCSIQSRNGHSRPVTAPLRPGEEFRLVFEGSQGAYLYVIAPSGLEQQPTVMLNGNPSDTTGLPTNFISAGERFAFPSQRNSWLILGKRSRITVVTILLSNAPLDDVDGLGTEPPTGLSDRQWCEIEKKSRHARSGIDVVEQPDGSCIVTCNGASCGGGIVSFELALEVILPATSAHFDPDLINYLDRGLRITTIGERS